MQDLANDYILTERQASGFKKLLMNSILDVERNLGSWLGYGTCVVYSTILEHYRSRGLTEYDLFQLLIG